LFSDTPSVKLITMHSSKGLEFEHVFVARINKIPEQDSDKHARLLYVAMTRAIENLTLTCHQESPFTRQVQQAIQQVTH
jgi:superfamily I DNA/RNA helicase